MAGIEFTHYASAVEWLQKLIETASEKNASDIHIDPHEDCARVQLRVDGILREHEYIPRHTYADGIGRLKILSQLKTDEHMAPQDGRLSITLPNGMRLDIRISIVPSYFGESVVLRLLHNTLHARSLSDLGLSGKNLENILSAMKRSSGMILVTGPTGSGKTTTLYTLLRMLNDSTRSIVTIEDPIEYSIRGVRQVQVNHARALTFASGLRSILRQDPDVIMVGEIRDSETAKLATHAALTGHLVLSTLHTTDAATAVPRLIDMGVEPYLITSTLSVVISQRLVRKKCSSCAAGCELCHFESFCGRIGIYETLPCSRNISSEIMKRSPAHIIRDTALSDGMSSMENDGMEKVEAGITCLDEIIAALHQ